MRKSKVLLILFIIILVPLAWLGYTKFEGKPPTLKMVSDVKYIGKKTPLSIKIEDAESGIKKVKIDLKQNAKISDVFQKDFPSESWLVGGKIKQETINFDIQPSELGISNGNATLNVTVWDYSLRGWFNGNKATFSREVTIDTTPPVISVISNTRYLGQGGTGVVCFSATDQLSKAGAQVDDSYFPGVPLDPGRNLYVAYFALPYDKPDAKLEVKCADLAGNEATSGFYNTIKPRKFRHDSIQLSDNFLQLIASRAQQHDTSAPSDPLAAFLKVNSELRRVNNKEISEICSKASPERLWKGAFMPLPNAQARARFADERTYVYKGKDVGGSVHLGLDLASLANSPVPAANNGIVVWADDLGIYGNAIVIDHGQGVFSLYAHLSSFKVKKGDMVQKGQDIGLTGYTGLAGGDHLHFGTYVGGKAVNPMEWLDPNWIKKKIELPLQDALKTH